MACFKNLLFRICFKTLVSAPRLFYNRIKIKYFGVKAKLFATLQFLQFYDGATINTYVYIKHV